MKAAVLSRPADSCWSVPREWGGERCFVLGGGASLQIPLIPFLRGRIIAIKQTVAHRPDADVMFVSGRDDTKVCAHYFTRYTGPRIICRNWYPGFPKRVLTLQRTVGGLYSRLPTHLGGLDAGTSAINLAALFGAQEIVLLGIDMTGKRWVQGHHLPIIPQQHFDWHLENLRLMAPQLKADGVRVVNCSPVSRVECFERQPLEAFL
jgi:hypothetical protein